MERAEGENLRSEAFQDSQAFRVVKGKRLILRHGDPGTNFGRPWRFLTTDHVRRCLRQSLDSVQIHLRPHGAANGSHRFLIPLVLFRR